MSFFPTGLRRDLNDNDVQKEEFRNPAVTVDVIVYNIALSSILLIKRKKDPFKGHWALPGGYLNYGLETTEKTGVRELKEETGLIADTKRLKLVSVKSEPLRDPRQHTISIIYYISKRYCKGKEKAADDAIELKWFKLSQLPKKIAFDHKEIIKEWRDKGEN